MSSSALCVAVLAFLCCSAAFAATTTGESGVQTRITTTCNRGVANVVGNLTFVITEAFSLLEVLSAIPIGILPCLGSNANPLNLGLCVIGDLTTNLSQLFSATSQIIQAVVLVVRQFATLQRECGQVSDPNITSMLPSPNPPSTPGLPTPDPPSTPWLPTPDPPTTPWLPAPDSPLTPELPTPYTPSTPGLPPPNTPSTPGLPAPSPPSTAGFPIPNLPSIPGFPILNLPLFPGLSG